MQQIIIKNKYDILVDLYKCATICLFEQEEHLFFFTFLLCFNSVFIGDLSIMESNAHQYYLSLYIHT